jgi:hypothetical protein
MSGRADFDGDHILTDTGLADVDAELKEFAVDAWCTPKRVVAAHLANQLASAATLGRPRRP